MTIKKILTIFGLATLLGFAIGLSVFADTTTTRYGLTKPDIGSVNWGPKLNTNADTIDNAAGINLANTFSQPQTFNGGVVGQLSGNASAGQVGEYMSNNITSFANATTTGSFINITQVNLTTGDWDVNGVIVYHANGATVSNYISIALSAYSGNTTTDHTIGYNQIDTTALPNANGDTSMTLPRVRFNIGSNTAIFVKGRYNAFTGGPGQWVGSINARRIR